MITARRQWQPLQPELTSKPTIRRRASRTLRQLAAYTTPMTLVSSTAALAARQKNESPSLAAPECPLTPHPLLSPPLPAYHRLSHRRGQLRYPFCMMDANWDKVMANLIVEMGARQWVVDMVTVEITCEVVVFTKG